MIHTWITVDAQSFGGEGPQHNVSRSAINRHVGRVSRTWARRSSKVGTVTAPKRLLWAWTTRVAPPTSKQVVEEIARSTVHLTQNAIKNQAQDPFSCLPVQLDSSMHRLLDHFLTTFHGTFWEAKTPAHLVQGPDPNTVIIIKDSIEDKARLLSLMACVAAYTERLIPSTDHDGRSTALYTQRALRAVRKGIAGTRFNRTNALLSIVNLAVSATVLRQWGAALIHLSAAKQLMDLEGGIEKTDLWILQAIVRADLGRSVSTLSPPIFRLAPLPVSRILSFVRVDTDAVLKDLAKQVLRQRADKPMTTDLVEIVYDVVRCGFMLADCHTELPRAVETMSMALYSGSVFMYQLLLMLFDEHEDAAQKGKLEVTRLTMILWSLVLRVLAQKADFSRGIATSLPIFDISKADAKRRNLPPEVFELLNDWNVMVSLDITLEQVMRVAEALEAYTDVHLGSFMKRLIILMEGHNVPKVATKWMKEAWGSEVNSRQ